MKTKPGAPTNRNRARRILIHVVGPRHSPNGSLQPVKFFTGVDDFPVFVGEDVRSEVEADVPVVLHLLQTTLSAQQSVQSHT